MAKSKKEQELSDFLANFYIDDEIIELIQIINAPDEEPDIPLEATSTVSLITPEKAKAEGNLTGIVFKYTYIHLSNLEEMGKVSSFTYDQLRDALYKHLNVFQWSKKT